MNNCTWSLTGLLLTTADWSELMMSLSGGAPWIQWKPGIRRPDCLGEKHRSSFSCLEKWLNTVCLTKVQDCFWIIKQKKFFFFKPCNDTDLTEMFQNTPQLKFVLSTPSDSGGRLVTTALCWAAARVFNQRCYWNCCTRLHCVSGDEVAVKKKRKKKFSQPLFVCYPLIKMPLWCLDI